MTVEPKNAVEGEVNTSFEHVNHIYTFSGRFTAVLTGQLNPSASESTLSLSSDSCFSLKRVCSSWGWFLLRSREADKSLIHQRISSDPADDRDPQESVQKGGGSRPGSRSAVCGVPKADIARVPESVGHRGHFEKPRAMHLFRTAGCKGFAPAAMQRACAEGISKRLRESNASHARRQYIHRACGIASCVSCVTPHPARVADRHANKQKKG
ncbi:hypothetical protein C8R43DRAFT_1105613 [Mycena crocata]|nr:hypothetical protein C8R43DRAFT_1105613 [Mycena crocata]